MVRRVLVLVAGLVGCDSGPGAPSADAPQAEQSQPVQGTIRITFTNNSSDTLRFASDDWTVEQGPGKHSYSGDAFAEEVIAPGQTVRSAPITGNVGQWMNTSWLLMDATTSQWIPRGTPGAILVPFKAGASEFAVTYTRDPRSQKGSSRCILDGVPFTEHCQ